MAEHDRWYKKEIVEQMVQAARVDLFGGYIEDDILVRLSPSEEEHYKEYLISQALVAARNLLISQTDNIDYEVNE